MPVPQKAFPALRSVVDPTARHVDFDAARREIRHILDAVDAAAAIPPDPDQPFPVLGRLLARVRGDGPHNDLSGPVLAAAEAELAWARRHEGAPPLELVSTDDLVNEFLRRFDTAAVVCESLLDKDTRKSFWRWSGYPTAAIGLCWRLASEIDKTLTALSQEARDA